ncbi:MAG: hypothetical protein ACK5H1_00750 [Tenacibaculum sp.]
MIHLAIPTLYYLILIAVGLICAFFGFLIGKLLNDKTLKANLNDEIKKLEVELKNCKQSNLHLESKLSNIKSSEETSFDASTAMTIFGKKIKQNDLKIVEGIGLKIEELFHNFNIKTWKSLSETSVEKCREILNSGGSSFKMHQPKTWPKQAQLAYEGKWEELAKWQAELNGGKT